MTQAAKAGDKLRIHYTVRLEDGAILDKSEGREPLEFTSGSGDIIPGLDKGLIGMEVGETRKLTVPPEDAYGAREDDRVHTVPRETIPDHIPTELGAQLSMKTEDGRNITAVVSGATESHVELDTNHPLAGQTLNFQVTLVEIV